MLGALALAIPGAEEFAPVLGSISLFTGAGATIAYAVGGDGQDAMANSVGTLVSLPLMGIGGLGHWAGDAIVKGGMGELAQAYVRDGIPGMIRVADGGTLTRGGRLATGVFGATSNSAGFFSTFFDSQPNVDPGRSGW